MVTYYIAGNQVPDQPKHIRSEISITKRNRVRNYTLLGGKTVPYAVGTDAAELEFLAGALDSEGERWARMMSELADNREVQPIVFRGDKRYEGYYVVDRVDLRERARQPYGMCEYAIRMVRVSEAEWKPTVSISKTVIEDDFNICELIVNSCESLTSWASDEGSNSSATEETSELYYVKDTRSIRLYGSIYQGEWVFLKYTESSGISIYNRKYLTFWARWNHTDDIRLDVLLYSDASNYRTYRVYLDEDDEWRFVVIDLDNYYSETGTLNVKSVKDFKFQLVNEGSEDHSYNFFIDDIRVMSVATFSLPTGADAVSVEKMFTRECKDGNLNVLDLVPSRISNLDIVYADDELETVTDQLYNSVSYVCGLDPYGGEVKVYDDMRSSTESDWQRVYSPKHKFYGDCVIENGLIRLKTRKYADDGLRGNVEVYAYDLSGSQWLKVGEWSPVTCYDEFDKPNADWSFLGLSNPRWVYVDGELHQLDTNSVKRFALSSVKSRCGVVETEAKTSDEAGLVFGADRIMDYSYCNKNYFICRMDYVDGTNDKIYADKVIDGAKTELGNASTTISTSTYYTLMAQVTYDSTNSYISMWKDGTKLLSNLNTSNILDGYLGLASYSKNNYFKYFKVWGSELEKVSANRIAYHSCSIQLYYADEIYTIRLDRGRYLAKIENNSNEPRELIIYTDGLAKISYPESATSDATTEDYLNTVSITPANLKDNWLAIHDESTNAKMFIAAYQKRPSSVTLKKSGSEEMTRINFSSYGIIWIGGWVTDTQTNSSGSGLKDFLERGLYRDRNLSDKTHELVTDIEASWSVA